VPVEAAGICVTPISEMAGTFVPAAELEAEEAVFVAVCVAWDSAAVVEVEVVSPPLPFEEDDDDDEPPAEPTSSLHCLSSRV